MSAYTKVQMTFDVTFSQPWGEDCSMDQAREVANKIVTAILRGGSEHTALKEINPSFTLVMPREES